MISCENISIKYIKQFYSLYDINHTFNVGDKILLVGDDASGNSFLLRIIAGIDRPKNGKIKITNFSRKEIGYLPSVPVFFERKTPLENLTYPLRIRKMKKIEAKLYAENVCHKYECDYILNKQLKDMDENEKQTLALLRLVARKPKIVLLDLMKYGEKNLNIISDLIKTSEIAIVATQTEDENIIHNQLLHMYNGSIMQ